MEEIKELVDTAVLKSQEHIRNGNLVGARDLLKQALKVDPDCEPAMRLLAQVYLNFQKSSEAILLYEKILKKAPTDQEALNNIALCYSSIGIANKCIEKLEKCLELYPDEPMCYSNLAIHSKDPKEKIKIYKKGIERLPESHDIRFNYGVCLNEQFQFDEAIYQYKKAIEIKPDFYLPHFNLALVNLLLGNYEEGWKGYEWRFGVPSFKKFKSRFAPKKDGKTILVYNEQGAGDAIQFARYFPLLKKKGYKVIYESTFELMDLMTQCEGIDYIVPYRQKLPDYDIPISIGSLPFFLEEYEPLWNGSYLKPTGVVDPFENYKELNKIGICWAGNPVHKLDQQRSCMLKHFKHLTGKGIKLFSLLKDTRSRYWADKGVVDLTEDCMDMGVVDMSDLLINFNYTATIMKCMDHIVTVDTAIAHLAGAMGLPCYMLVQHMPDWRWGLKGINKWYPSVKIMRQATPGDYESILKTIAREVKIETISTGTR